MNVTTVTKPAYGDGASTFASRNGAALTNSDTNEQGIEDRLEKSFNDLFGTGVLAGSYTAPLLAAGAGLNLDIAAHKSLIGFGLEDSDGGSVVLADDDTLYIWEFQDGTYTYSTADVNPGTTANPAIRLGSAVTLSGAVDSVDNTRTELQISNVVSPGNEMLVRTDSDGQLAETTVVAPLAFDGTTLSIPAADTDTDGYLKQADWNTFNNKQPAGSYLTAEADTLATVTGRGATTTTFITASGGAQVTKDSGTGDILSVRANTGWTGTYLMTAVNLASAQVFSVEDDGTLQAAGPAMINGMQISSGVGTPNGSVTGSVGDFYTDRSGGAGTTLYIKESGSATNTGWVAK